MERQRNIPQIKEQHKSLEKEQNKMKEGNLPDTDFKTINIKMLKEFRGRWDEFSENLNKEIISAKGYIETIFKNWPEIKNKIFEKNTLKGLNSRLDKAED